MIKIISSTIVMAGLLSLAVSANAEPPINSIKMIHSTNFDIDRSELDDIKALMQAAVDDAHIPGALLLVGNDEGIGLVETVGYQGPEDNTPVNLDTIFRIYSMTKPIVSVATMTMVEDGLIRLDDPVSKYIPEFAELKVMDDTSFFVPASKAYRIAEPIHGAMADNTVVRPMLSAGG